MVRMKSFARFHAQDFALVILPMPLREVDPQFVIAGAKIEKAITLHGVRGRRQCGGNQARRRQTAGFTWRGVGAQDLDDNIREE